MVSLGSGALSAHVQCSAHIMLAFCVADEEELHFVLSGIVESNSRLGWEGELAGEVAMNSDPSKVQLWSQWKNCPCWACSWSLATICYCCGRLPFLLRGEERRNKISEEAKN